MIDYWIAARAKIDARSHQGAAPVPGSVPAGTNIREAAEFERLEAEVRRMDAHGPVAVDWRKVNALSLNILSNQSKDILVACWATYGLFRTEGYQGLAVGLGILRGMVDAHWDGLFPPIKRERARVGAVDWLVDRVGVAVAENAPTEADYPAVLAAYDALDDLARQLSQKLVDEQAALENLFRALKSYYEQAKRALAAAAEHAAEAARAAEQVAAAPAESTPPAEASQLATPDIIVSSGTDGDWVGFMDRLPDLLRQAAASRRVTSPADPKVYLLNRLGSWMRFDALPPDADGRTTIFPPADNISALEAKVAAGQHADVVNLAEEIVWTGPFWLDAHRHAANALEQIGPLFEPAAAVVRAAIALLVRRYPRILEFQFNDGRPFADEETRAWAAVGGADVSMARDPVDETVAEAHTLIGGGQQQAALEKLSRALDGATCERGRFVGHLAQARFCIETGFVTTAVPLLEHMDEVVAERNLESWEPALALDAAELRYRAMTHSDAQQIFDEPRRRAALEQIRTRVARINIARATQLGRS
ncbi:type VI secretion system protein TssA [Bradyrhizobium sp. BWA-3-5]|uniref:type VI secretion system protein TssA n=1 Tax=Bradyrhizobium sp. BWA-3-5 TaxID=3080013 RepID=UPI00293E89DF|nr:type VI secretion system protein TssA [Bradyrhizobium sp. BWA-3-5]WOH63809.1 type VI secretion system protein TssA [Bradyrhizobium sp. BWA-3-5]